MGELTPEWSSLFQFERSILELALRGTFVYFFFFVILRLVGRRELGSLGVADLLILLLVADAAGNAMSGGSSSMLDGLLVAGVIIAWGVILDRMAYYFPGIAKLTTPPRVCVVQDGRYMLRNMRREYLTREEVQREMRLAGIEDLEQIKRAYIEPNGELSFLEKSK